MMLQLSTKDWNVSVGDANANDGFHSTQIRNCQKPRKMAMARSFGHAARQILRPTAARGATGTSSASSPAVSARSSTAMAPHLVLEAGGDGGGEPGDVERVEASGSFDGDRVLLDDSPGTARQEDHPVAE